MILERLAIIFSFIYIIFNIVMLFRIIKGNMKISHKIALITCIIITLICVYLIFNFIMGNIWIFDVYEEHNGYLSLRVVYNKKHKPYSKYPNNILAYDVSLKTNKKNINKGDTLLIIPRIDVALIESAPAVFSPNRVFIMKVNVLKSFFSNFSNQENGSNSYVNEIP